MQFMVIERFRNQDAKPIYQRLRDEGRLMPDGVTFVSSWISADLARCFQIMEADDLALLQKWLAGWTDLVEFEIVAVTEGAVTAKIMME